MAGRADSPAADAPAAAQIAGAELARDALKAVNAAAKDSSAAMPLILAALRDAQAK